MPILSAIPSIDLSSMLRGSYRLLVFELAPDARAGLALDAAQLLSWSTLFLARPINNSHSIVHSPFARVERLLLRVQQSRHSEPEKMAFGIMHVRYLCGFETLSWVKRNAAPFNLKFATDIKIYFNSILPHCCRAPRGTDHNNRDSVMFIAIIF